MTCPTRTSIALCTYNGARFLRRQLDSFVRQTCLPDELVVCDDGSSDETTAILSQFAKTAPFPVRVVENESNLGSTKNFERAISLCRGEFIALADQDDEWYPDKLETFHRLFAAFPDALLAFSDADVIDDHDVLLKPRLWNRVHFSPLRRRPHIERDMLSTLLKLNSVATGATMVMRSQLRAQIVPIPDQWVHDAWIAWMAALSGPVAVLPEAKIRYRIHPRQQLGLDPPSFLDRLRHARQNAAKDYVDWIHKLEELRQYLEVKQNRQQKEVIPRINAKIRHMNSRMALSGSFLARTFRILSSWREYRQYARGTVSMLKDMFFPSESLLT